jgi:ribonuclease HI
VGGVLYNSGGTKILSFAWGMGMASNNQAEAMEVYMALKLINQAQNDDLI